jgi:hypothetical protein
LSATRSDELRPGAQRLFVELYREFINQLVLDLNVQPV